MRNLILFGDSMLANFGSDFIKQVETKISDIQIYNCAFGGATTHDGLNKVKLISSLKPDIVLLSFGINDLFKNNLSVERYLENIDKIIKSFNKRIIIWLTPKFNDINDVAGSKKYNKLISVYFDEVKKYCKDNGIEYIDSFNNYKVTIGKADPYHEDDGIHLTDDGYEPFVKELIKII